MGGPGSELCSLSPLTLGILNLCVLLSQYEFYVGTQVVEIADGWFLLRIVFIVGLGTEDVEPLDYATRE